MTERHLNEKQLAHRWSVSIRTLQRWRWAKTGPAYLKLGARVAYALVDIEAYEERTRKPPRPDASAPKGQSSHETR